MRELVIAVFLFLVIAAMGAVALVPWQSLFKVGVWFVTLGFLIGVPTGIIYHIQLYRVLKSHDVLPKGWIWRPTKLHSLLPKGERLRVLAWGIIGGLGFFAIVIGQFLLFASIILVQIRGTSS